MGDLGEAMQIWQGTHRVPNKWGLRRRCGMGAHAVYAVCTRFCYTACVKTVCVAALGNLWYPSEGGVGDVPPPLHSQNEQDHKNSIAANFW